MKQVTVEEIRAIQLELLDDVHNFCTSHNIRYSMSGGTLLGAVRHKGFIPWDDDIDVLMPRPDYERFIAEYDGSAKHHFAETYKNSSTCGVPFCKLCDTRTVLYEGSIMTGVNIDIFPIDGYPSKDGVDDFVDEFNRLIRLHGKTQRFYRYKGGWFAYIKYLIKCLIYPNHKKSVARLDALYNRYPFDTAKWAGGLVGSYARKEHMSAEVYREYIDMPFENKVYRGLKDFDTYLTVLYGDYMQLPPVEKRSGHHHVKAYWLE